MKFTTPKFVLLTILDGWGLATPGPGNAISLASTVNIDRYWVSFPHTQLEASGEAVGLPRGEVGNTETGHLNLGAGRIVYQDLARINMSIADGTFFDNPTLIAAIKHAKENNSKLHLMGLIGASGVHSSMDHLFALIELCKRQEFSNVFLHLFTDGRDSPQTSAKTYIAEISEVMSRDKIGTIASIMGRYWGMDRDYRWDRTAKAYNALTKGEGVLVKTLQEAIDDSYSQGKTDEFIEPALVAGSDGKPISLIGSNDSVIFFNFRIDRPRQLTSAFVFDELTPNELTFDFDPYKVRYEKKHISEKPVDGNLSGFNRGAKLQNLFFVTMTEYSKKITEHGAHVAFPPETVQTPIGKIISETGFKQLRASESEKERFVTFYFNGQIEGAFDQEERLIIPSPKVATYDLMPEMSAKKLTDDVLEKIKNDEYKLIVLNYANADMVGHTGSIGAAVKACEVIDECVGKLANWVLAYGGVMIITADHGNAETMINASTGEIDTEHNKTPVPFIAISSDLVGRAQTLQSGILSDVAPTILSILGLQIPSSMTGRNLLSSL